MYIPRRLQDTVLYTIIRERLSTFADHAARSYSAPLPKDVIDPFEHYLGCGDPPMA